jgi:hypothetical protein
MGRQGECIGNTTTTTTATAGSGTVVVEYGALHVVFMQIRLFGLNAGPPAPNAGAAAKLKLESIGAPILDCQFIAEDQILFCGLNRMVQLWNCQTNAVTNIGVVSVARSCAGGISKRVVLRSMTVECEMWCSSPSLVRL